LSQLGDHAAPSTLAWRGARPRCVASPLCGSRRCVAKNTLCVGATESSPHSFAALGLLPWTMRVLTAAGAELSSLELAASRTFGTAPYVMTPIVAPLVLADPPSACGALHAAPGAVLVAARGDCLFTEKASAAQRAGAVALLVMNTETGRLAMGGSGAIGIPVFALSKADAAVLRRLMEGAGGAVSAQLPLAPDASASAHSISKLAAFSSRGPAADGRVKPDILAPGFPVVSARSDGNLSTRQCGVSQVRRRPRRPT
jgi:hypothetical protein